VKDEEARPCRSVYVHVPFCAGFCDYCAFYSEIARPDWVERYVSALLRELDAVSKYIIPQTLFFGGGTPTLLELKHWEKILDAFHTCGRPPAWEWTVEGNPATLTHEKAHLLKAAGINRFSLGIQSLDDDLLARLGRAHSRQQALDSYDLLRTTGFDNLNVDLMFAIPTQSLAAWRHTLNSALDLQSEHLSCYEVTYEEDTPLYAQLQANRFSVDDDLVCDMYDLLLDHSQQAGLLQYEVSNFARNTTPQTGEFPSCACQHNINYWRGGDYIGLGPSASSYRNGVRSRNWANLDRYCQCLEHDQSPAEDTEQLGPRARAGELAAFGLRLQAGWPFALFQTITGFDLRHDWAPEIDSLLKLGYAEVTPERLRLTRAGLRYADWVAEQFLRPESPPA
jgi:oxygen-independent coproporphyrinogen III oxidase